jgi:hypothetical protein
VFVTVSHVNSRQIVAGKSRSLPFEWKVANSLDYFDVEFTMAVKCFIVLASGVNLLNIFSLSSLTKRLRSKSKLKFLGKARAYPG